MRDDVGDSNVVDFMVVMVWKYLLENNCVGDFCYVNDFHWEVNNIVA